MRRTGGRQFRPFHLVAAERVNEGDAVLAAGDRETAIERFTGAIRAYRDSGITEKQWCIARVEDRIRAMGLVPPPAAPIPYTVQAALDNAAGILNGTIKPPHRCPVCDATVELDGERYCSEYCANMVGSVLGEATLNMRKAMGRS